ncbi:MAG: glycosyltransferase [Chloroflexota bacterium]|nr:glycosyltransferase [Dehalococcoidia bacterium]MDW8254135.1 glycosyltransferase [Chloroflexota bacterium]
MRIATISYHGSPLAPPGVPSTGGMQVYVRELSRALAAQGHQVDVFTRKSDPTEPAVVVDRPGFRVINLIAGPLAPVAKSELPLYLCSFAREVLRFAEAEGQSYDLIHSHYWLSGRVGRALRSRWNVPHVTMFHTLAEVKNRARIGEREPDERISSERLLISDVDQIIVASAHERLQLLRFYEAVEEQISVVPCGVDLDHFRPLPKESARAAVGARGRYVVLFVGRIEPLKGIDILIRAAAELEERDDVEVIIAGGGSDGHRDELRRLRALAAECGIGDQVRFIGPQPQDRLVLWYNAADITVVPSYYESFGLVAVESMACGTPVIASRVGGLTSTVRDGETGYLIPWRCPEAFLERMELLLGNETLRRHFGEAARRSVERFRWSAIAEQIAAVYRAVVAPVVTRAAGR